MRSFVSSRWSWILALAVFVCNSAFAHPGHEVAGLESGFTHPLSGIDHILAMFAVGLWAYQMKGRSLWLVPLTFVGAMAVGGALGVGGVAVPFVEHGIVASILILGVLLAMAVHPPAYVTYPLIAFCALFHGHAHGTELPDGSSGLTYAAGFVASTALLHAGGLGVGFAFSRINNAKMLRVAGGAMAFCAILLWAGVLKG